ncbi:hypothetical protein MLD38_012828 [Melastoma candidum]|uniref:Uncharacterized protein n=1 Tax=Melastoma candidum TaxID=119954 RepID=A0ACB9R7L8_9MYRT|nr:hypothetical protein MLD38_012828 [Melastoma candidum]
MSTEELSQSCGGGGGGDGGKNYPAALSTHDDVVKDNVVFWDTLRRFHFMLGTKFMIPVIGGKELDLHTLYAEVTGRGGYEKVVTEKKWREVSNVFMFSPTTTSASFVLKKHYLSLLYHYEQVYFFGQQGPLCTPSDGFPVAGSSSKRRELVIHEPSSEAKSDCPDPALKGSSCYLTVGTIDGKFDSGYLVSVKLGSETLRGVLFHPNPNSSPPNPTPPAPNALVPFSCRIRRNRSRRNRRRGDPSYPKPNRSGYNFFFAEKHYKLKSLYPNREREFTKMIGESWTKLSPDERMVYQRIGLKDKERYKRELQEYQERLKNGKRTDEGII